MAAPLKDFDTFKYHVREVQPLGEIGRSGSELYQGKATPKSGGGVEQAVVIKTAPAKAGNNNADLIKEIEVFKSLSRGGTIEGKRRLPAFFEECNDKGRMIVVMSQGGLSLSRKYGDDTNVNDPKVYCNPPKSLADALLVTIDVLEALKVLHQKGWIHCHVQPKNIIEVKQGTSDDGWMLIDFGACSKANSEKALPRCWEYSAPEQWLNDTVCEKTDVFGATCVLFYLIVGNAPFAGSERKECEDKCTNIDDNFDDLIKGVENRLSPSHVDMFNSCGVDGDNGLRHLFLNGMKEKKGDRWGLDKMLEELRKALTYFQNKGGGEDDEINEDLFDNLEDDNRCRFCVGLPCETSQDKCCAVCDGDGYNLTFEQRFQKLLWCCNLRESDVPGDSSCDRFFNALLDQLRRKQWFQTWHPNYKSLKYNDIRVICAKHMENNFSAKYEKLIKRCGYGDSKNFVRILRTPNSNYDIDGYLELEAVNSWIQENVAQSYGVVCKFVIYSPDSTRCAKAQRILFHEDDDCDDDDDDDDKVIRLARYSETASRGARYGSLFAPSKEAFYERQNMLLPPSRILPADLNCKDYLMISRYNARGFEKFMNKIRELRNEGIQNLPFFQHYYDFYSQNFFCVNPSCYRVKRDDDDYCNIHQMISPKLVLFKDQVKELYDELEKGKRIGGGDNSLHLLFNSVFETLNVLKDDARKDVNDIACKVEVLLIFLQIDIREFFGSTSENRVSLDVLRSWMKTVLAKREDTSDARDTEDTEDVGMSIETEVSAASARIIKDYGVLRELTDDPVRFYGEEEAEILKYTYYKVYFKHDLQTEYICRGKIRKREENESSLECKYVFNENTDYSTIEDKGQILAFKEKLGSKEKENEKVSEDAAAVVEEEDDDDMMDLGDEIVDNSVEKQQLAMLENPQLTSLVDEIFENLNFKDRTRPITLKDLELALNRKHDDGWKVRVYKELERLIALAYCPKPCLFPHCFNIRVDPSVYCDSHIREKLCRFHSIDGEVYEAKTPINTYIASSLKFCQLCDDGPKEVQGILSKNCFSCDFKKCVGANGGRITSNTQDFCDNQKLYPSNQCKEHLLCEYICAEDDGSPTGGQILTRCEDFRLKDRYYCEKHCNEMPKLVILHHEDFEMDDVDPSAKTGSESPRYYIDLVSNENIKSGKVYSKKAVEDDEVGMSFIREIRKVFFRRDRDDVNGMIKHICDSGFHTENDYKNNMSIFTDAAQSNRVIAVGDEDSLVGPNTGNAAIRAVSAVVEAVDIAYTSREVCFGHAVTSVFCLIR
jgi:serine/threonine protein kinase